MDNNLTTTTCQNEKHSIGACIDMKEYAIFIAIAVLVIVCICVICCKCYYDKKQRKQIEIYQRMVNEQNNEDESLGIDNNDNNQNHADISKTDVSINSDIKDGSNISVNVTTMVTMPVIQTQLIQPQYPYHTQQPQQPVQQQPQHHGSIQFR